MGKLLPRIIWINSFLESYELIFQMSAFVAMAKEKGLATLASTVCATGGGAYKFEADIKREVNLRLNKFDELDSLIRGKFKFKLDFIFL